MLSQSRQSSQKWKTIETNIQIGPTKLSTLITSPYASKIYHQCLHPAIYRNISAIYTVDEFAEFIAAPSGWREVVDQVLSNENVESAVEDLINLDQNVIESIKYLSLGHLLKAINQVAVGGFTVLDNYDYQSKTDLTVIDRNTQIPLLAFELNTDVSYPMSPNFWHHKSRGSQVFAALFGHCCPTILMTLKQFKVFCQNQNRTQVFTYPFGISEFPIHVNLSMTQTIGGELVEIISLCLIKAIASKPPPRGLIKRSTPRNVLPFPQSDQKKLSKKNVPSKDFKISKLDFSKESSFTVTNPETGLLEQRKIRVYHQESIEMIDQMEADVGNEAIFEAEE